MESTLGTSLLKRIAHNNVAWLTSEGVVYEIFRSPLYMRFSKEIEIADLFVVAYHRFR